jgi:hypothetical protein
MNAQGYLALDDAELGTRLGSNRKSAETIYRPILQHLAEAPPKTPEQIAAALGWSAKKVRAKLTDLVSVDGEIFGATSEFMPSVASVMDIVERQLGQINAGNLAQANQVCSDIVHSIIEPRYESFVRRSLGHRIDGATNALNISVHELVNFLLGDYKTFVKQQDQGLTSKVGGLNEAILGRALTNAGLVKGTDFDVTGKRGNGDLAVYCNVTNPRAKLLVEVKSYGARERLLRGLQDVHPPKIGVGFFNRADEFNPARTTQFLTTQALAIYMPAATYAALEEVARARTNHRGSRFYRPLEDFVPDIQGFTQAGEEAYDA